ncbi:uncharacterized protein [Branchiostoma lanceolatum]|uniref:uncharacterized protein n=1 Tax=Branchiostoma lanceolatum TaxID=7740 RepID=UPI0034536F05
MVPLLAVLLTVSVVVTSGGATTAPTTTAAATTPPVCPGGNATLCEPKIKGFGTFTPVRVSRGFFPLNCSLQSAAAAAMATWTWRKDGVVLRDTPDGHIKLTTDRTSTLLTVQHDLSDRDAGNYNCSVTTAFGTDSYQGRVVIRESQGHVLVVNAEQTQVWAWPGENVNLTCNLVTGKGQVPTGSWLKEGSPVPDIAGGHTEWKPGLVNTTDKTRTTRQQILIIRGVNASDYGNYTCVGQLKGLSDSKTIQLLRQEPREGLPLPVTLGIAAAGVVALVAMATGLAIRRRKYDPDLGWDKPDPEAEYNIPYENELPKYDIFISYSCKDLAFAKDVLLKELTCRGYEVCVDFKDFTPGVFIVDNIKEGVFRSRKTIIVLSSNFRKSGFGRFELQMAGARKYLERKDVLIVVKIDQCKVPTMLIGRTFLDWTNENVRPHFWQRLENAIGPDQKVRDRKDHKDNQEEEAEEKEEEETITAEDDRDHKNNAVNGHIANGGPHILGLPETDLLENEDRPLLAVV